MQHLESGKDRLERLGEAIAAFRRLAPEDYGPFLATIEADLGDSTAPELIARGAAPARLLAATPAAPANDVDPPVTPAYMAPEQPPAAQRAPEAQAEAQATDPAPVVTEDAPAAAPARRKRNGQRNQEVRALVLELLGDGRGRSTKEVRLELSLPSEDVPRLGMEMYKLRQESLVEVDGDHRHTLISARAANGNARSAPSTRPTPPPPPVRAPTTTRVAAPVPVERPRPRVAPPVKRSAVAPRRDRAPRGAKVKGKAKRKRTDDERRPARTAEQIYSSAIADHELLKLPDELALAKRLEEVELALWQTLLDGPTAPMVATEFAALEPPLETTDPVVARRADLELEIVRAVVCRAKAAIANTDPPDPAITAVIAMVERAIAESMRIRERFVRCNLRMVIAVIRRHGYHNGTQISMADLIQEGNIGLMRAIPTYDWRREMRFNTYAGWWIRHALVRARQNLGSEIRLPVHLIELTQRANRKRRELTLELGRKPTNEELAIALDAPIKSVRALENVQLTRRESIPSFDSTGDEGELPSMFTSDDQPIDEALMDRQERERLERAIGQLPPFEASIIRGRFGIGGEVLKLRELGAARDLSRERIRQLETQALARLRVIMRQRAA